MHRRQALLWGGAAIAIAALVQAAPAVGRSQADRTFRVAILLSAARPPAEADIARLWARANDILVQKTGARMSRLDLADVGPGNALEHVRTYLAAHAASAPDGVLVFSDDRESTTYGGYSVSVPLPDGARNRFPSPAEGDDKAYVAVIDAAHWYAKCGYDGRGERVSPRSRGGECRSTPGLMCVDNGRYWMCPDSTADPNANADYFLACDIVHEFVHPFGRLGDNDHYGTAPCGARTNMSPADAADRTLNQQSCGMCPDLFTTFKPRE